MSKWQPIETIPKEGYVIVAGRDHDGAWIIATAIFFPDEDGEGGEFELEDLTGTEWWQSEDAPFTHWMHLPAPPADH